MHKPSELDRSNQSSAPQACWTSPIWFGLHRSLVLNQPPSHKAALYTCSLGPTGLPTFPRNTTSLFLWVHLRPFSSLLVEHQSQKVLIGTAVSTPKPPGPWWVPQTVFSCHLAVWEEWKASLTKCPQVSEEVRQGNCFPNAQKSGGIKMKMEGLAQGREVRGWRWRG